MTTTSPSHANLNRALRVSEQLAVSVGKGVLKAMLYVVFLALMWLRGIVHLVTGACAGIGLLALVIAAFLKPEFWLLWKLGAFSFAAFLAGWMYDGLLLAISPESIILGERTAR
ncbi:hypothetical protein VI06_10510 [Aquitalea magnusonii]|nr:hypothetical protein VI06_10510 [Aquitalea magnusonii]